MGQGEIDENGEGENKSERPERERGDVWLSVKTVLPHWPPSALAFFARTYCIEYCVRTVDTGKKCVIRTGMLTVGTLDR